MKMIVSDYDNTIKRFYGIPNTIQKIDLILDLRYIKKFIEEGNLFNISSKRTITSIREEIEKYKVPYSYITANGGLVTFDKNDKLIYAEYLEKEMLIAIEELSKKTNLLENLTMYDVNGNKQKELKDELISVGLTVRNVRDTIAFFKSLNIDLGKYHLSHKRFGFSISNVVNKKIGIDLLLEKMDNKPEEIITVGDSFHDIEMIYEYNGWCIKDSELDLYNSGSINRIPNIRTLIKKVK